MGRAKPLGEAAGVAVALVLNPAETVALQGQPDWREEVIALIGS